MRLLQRRGLLDNTLVDEFSASEPLQAALSAASVQRQLATGERAGQPVRRLSSDAAQAVRRASLKSMPDQAVKPRGLYGPWVVARRNQATHPTAARPAPGPHSFARTRRQAQEI